MEIVFPVNKREHVQTCKGSYYNKRQQEYCFFLFYRNIQIYKDLGHLKMTTNNIHVFVAQYFSWTRHTPDVGFDKGSPNLGLVLGNAKR